MKGSNDSIEQLARNKLSINYTAQVTYQRVLIKQLDLLTTKVYLAWKENCCVAAMVEFTGWRGNFHGYRSVLAHSEYAIAQFETILFVWGAQDSL